MTNFFRWCETVLTVFAVVAVMGCNNPADKLKPVSDTDLILKSLVVFAKYAMSKVVAVESTKTKTTTNHVKAVFTYGSVDEQEVEVIVDDGELNAIDPSKVKLSSAAVTRTPFIKKTFTIVYKLLCRLHQFFIAML